MIGLRLAERGWLPDAALRLGIRRLVRERLQEPDVTSAFLASLRGGPVARLPEKANEQHYEVAPAFYEQVLGPRLKYSCALFEQPGTRLAEAEEAMLRATCRHAGLRDGMRVLELGCGWGSLTLWMAERLPLARITAVSNSKLQREFILGRCQQRGIRNVEVLTRDVNELELDARFDRVVSVEMFEHMHGVPELLRRVRGWLEPDGRLFVHLFCHRERAYPFEDRGDGDWMARHFFSGGMMPSEGMLHDFDEDLRVSRHWRIGGEHYARTADAWLANLDARREAVWPALQATYGEAEAALWYRRWRLFFLAVSELFGYAGGTEWLVSHYLMEPVR